MVSTLSPGATVIAVPPSQLQLPEEPDLRTTDPVPFETMVLPLPATDGCGACAVCACGIEAVASGWVRDAKGLSLNRDVSPLQPATPALISASTAACGRRRGRNISRPRHMHPHPYAQACQINTLRVNTTLIGYEPVSFQLLAQER